MKTYAIVIKDNPISEDGFKWLKQSSKQYNQHLIDIQRFDAFTPLQAHEFMEKTSLRWTWPWEGTELDIRSGIKMTAYAGTNPLARVACFLSHYHLWEKCVQDQDAYLILEHDAVFLKPLMMNTEIKDGIAVAINDPRGNTRKAAVYHQMVQDSTGVMCEVPWIDNDRGIAQGLPGNSAYIITPKLAEDLIKATKEYGMWPNDALMCKQLFPNRLFILRDYVTSTIVMPSTTSS